MYTDASFPGIAAGSAEEGLLRAIASDLESDTPRLIYADWLEEQGDAERAEFLRLQCQLVESPLDAFQSDAMAGRARELELRYGLVWKQRLPEELQGRSLFHRGLLTGMACAVEAFPQVAEAFLAGNPLLHVLQVYPGQSSLRYQAWDRFFSSPWLRHFTSLDLSNNWMGNLGASVLANCPHLENLSELDLSGNNINDLAMPALMDATLPALRRLKLRSNEFGDRGITLLARSGRLTRLQRLDLNWNRIGDAGLSALVRGQYLSSLEILDLRGNNIRENSVKVLLKSTALPRLRRLLLDGRGVFSKPTAKALRRRIPELAL